MKRFMTIVVPAAFWIFTSGLMEISAQCNCSVSASCLSPDQSAGASLVLTPRQWTVELSGEYRLFREPDARNSTDGHTHHHSDGMQIGMLNTMAGVRAGLTRKLTVALQLPFTHISAGSEKQAGLSDLLLSGILKVYDRKSFSAALMAGMEIPVGSEATLEGTGNIVMGSGSWDPVAGLLLQKTWSRCFVRGSLLFKQSTAGFDHTNFGSFLGENITFSYRIKGEPVSAPDTASCRKKLALTVSANLSGESYEPQKQFGRNLPDTGANILYAGCGVQVSLGNWSLPINVWLPTWQNFRGEQSEARFRVRMGIVKTFF